MKRKRIVMVEDEADVARYLAAAITDEGYEVFIATNAEEGTSLVHSEQPDLVCLDLVMPGRTGASLYRELREATELSGMPIVVVSGVSAEDAQDRLLFGEGFTPPDAFIEKPVNLPLLIETLRGLLAS
jgi:DNA-binding response OmpR family regulator